MFENIKSIKHFDSAYELIDYMECIDSLGLSDDEIDYLTSINDYDDFGFFLINGDTVIISDYFGDVSGSAMSYDEFLKNTLEEELAEIRKKENEFSAHHLKVKVRKHSSERV